MTDSSGLAWWRPRYLLYGPITDLPRSDRSEIAKLIQRGRPVTEDRLVQPALTYARFRRRLCRVFGVTFLVLAAAEAVTAPFTSRNVWIVDAVISAGWLLSGSTWCYLAVRCGRGGQATARAHGGGGRDAR
jgi:hypothetical protein